MADRGIYQPAYVQALFDEMARTYGVVNLFSSFGFAVLWRWQCVHQLPLKTGERVVDLMAGMGELGSMLARRVGKSGHLCAVDISPVMCERARGAAKRWRCGNEVRQEDALALDLPDDYADAVVSCFGLKTFSDEQLGILAQQIARVLRPGGRFSLLEISVPPAKVLRYPYMFYLKSVVPVLGRLFLGNPENYRMLGVYTEAFGNCERAMAHLRAAGLSVEGRRFFFGCATGIVGRKGE